MSYGEKEKDMAEQETMVVAVDRMIALQVEIAELYQANGARANKLKHQEALFKLAVDEVHRLHKEVGRLKTLMGVAAKALYETRHFVKSGKIMSVRQTLEEEAAKPRWRW